MKLKASVDYGIRAVFYLALENRTCSSREIAEKMDIPRDYLIQLALHLRKAGVITTKPGKNGGYALAVAPSKITMGKLMGIFEGDGKRATRKRSRGDSPKAMANRMEKLAMEGIVEFLESITVQDLMDAAAGEGTSSDIVAEVIQRKYGANTPNE